MSGPPPDIRNKEEDATSAAVDAIGAVASTAVQVSDAFKGAMTEEGGKAVGDFFDQIGLARGLGLAIAGTHLGTFIGGCYELRLSAAEMVDSLMHLYLRAALPTEQMLRHVHTPDNHEHLDLSAPIVLAVLRVLEKQVRPGHDVAVSMRKYLTLLVTMVHEGSAQIEAQSRRVDD